MSVVSTTKIASSEAGSVLLAFSLTVWRAPGRFGTRQRLDIAMLAGHHEMLAGVLDSACLPLEAGTEEQLARAPIHGPG